MRLRAILVVGVLFGLAGCPPSQPVTKDLTVSVDPAEVLADGATTVAVTVSGAGTGVKVTVRTPKGTWQGYEKNTIEVPGGNGTVTLVTCDSRVDATCPGTVRLTALGDDDSSGTASVKFLPGEQCLDALDNDGDGKTDCSDDGCLGRSCTLPKNAGTGTCQADGTCICTLGTAEICTDNLDNNCDAKVDCADATCAGKICTLGSGVPGLCAGASCACPNAKEEKAAAGSCADHVDNDCDGLVDCADSACQPTGNDPGGACDTLGNTCSPVVAGVSSCIVCSGNGGGYEATEATCDDGKDNDCNGKADCQDPACAGVICEKATGKVCGATTLLCECAGTPGEPEALCDDLKDNDCDGKVDCEDDDCGAGTACTDPVRGPAYSFGAVCVVESGKRSCKCQPQGGAAEAGKELTCTEGVDNDCDSQTDCADDDCGNKPCGAAGKGMICKSTSKTCDCPDGWSPDLSGKCQCNAGSAETCDDLVDNNCDTKVDCDDSTCTGKICIITTTGQKGVCGTGGCACPNKPEVCNDGIDNDCDGQPDCDDFECQPDGNNLGKVCDKNGNTCSTVSGGKSTCTVCGGGGGARQTAESLCGDGFDNDCDGSKDCQDPDCAGLRCSSTGMLCTGATRTCDCPGGVFESTCDDGVDNDCDGLVDCADTDCVAGTACHLFDKPSFGTVCDSQKKCSCSGNGGTAEAKEATCNDAHDNDCDGQADCADTDCQPTAPGASDGKLCSTAALGRKCNATGQCACPLGQATETTCDDGLDNDCDGLKDCADTDCRGLACDTKGKKCSTTTLLCECPTGLVAETDCANNVDDDCDGLADCADPDCNGKNCSGVSLNYQCISNVCKDVSTTFSLVLAAVPSRIPANGTATATITATLKDGTTPLPNKTVTFAVAGPGTVSVAPVTNGSGVTTVTYTSGVAVGPALVTATYNTGTQDIQGTVSIDTPRVGQVKLVSQQFSIMGVKYSSYQESNLLRFQVLDVDNSPYPPGLLVTFTHVPASGSSFSTGSCTSSLCTSTALTDSKGEVAVTLNSGTAASVVSVQADTAAGGGVGNATAGNIAIVGAKTSGSHISLVCSPYNVPGFDDHDCTQSKVNATVNCTASFADRFNNVLGVPTIATLSTEAGAAGPPSTTDKNGVAKNFVAVQNFRLPVDVTPDTGEHGLGYDSGCGVKVHNPRDGLVTIVVSASGEEGFVDGSNGCPADGVYNNGVTPPCTGTGSKPGVGENFIDIGEPFVDADDNGTQNDGEYYIDVNNNGGWDGPNGAWDGNTVIWAETRVVYTGYSAVVVSSASDPLYYVSRFFSLGTTPPLVDTVAPRFSVLSSDGGATATSQTFGVYFADKNFNVLVAPTAFAVKVVTGTVTAKFTTDLKGPDVLGMLFTQQFCDTSGANCDNICKAAPCRVNTSVSNFALGNYGAVQITGGSKPDLGFDEVRATATYNGIENSVSIFGRCN